MAALCGLEFSFALAPRGDVRRGQSCRGPTELWGAGQGPSGEGPGDGGEQFVSLSRRPLAALVEAWQGLGWPAKETQGSLCDWGLVDTGPHQSRRAKDLPATTRVDHSPGQPNLHASKQPSGPRSQALSLSALAFNRLTVGQPHAGALSPVT